jgi:hypothetical protein
MEVKIVKLISGEEVLGEIESIENHQVTLKNPVGVAVVRGANGQPSVGFTPFPLHAEQIKEKSFTFTQNVILYVYTPAKDFVDNYNQIFGSGIVLPNKQLVTG